MKRKILALLAVIAVSGVVFTGCDLLEQIGGGGDATAYEPLVIRGKTMNGDDIEITITTTRTAPRTVLTPANGDSYVLRVNGYETSRGTIGLNEGFMTLYPSNGNPPFTATYNGTNFSGLVVNMYESGAVTGVTLDRTTLDLPFAVTVQLTATVIPSNAMNRTVTWSSSNNDVAIVSPTGAVTAKASTGSATITATTVDGGMTASCVVNVNGDWVVEFSWNAAGWETGVNINGVHHSYPTEFNGGVPYAKTTLDRRYREYLVWDNDRDFTYAEMDDPNNTNRIPAEKRYLPWTVYARVNKKFIPKGKTLSDYSGANPVRDYDFDSVYATGVKSDTLQLGDIWVLGATDSGSDWTRDSGGWVSYPEDGWTYFKYAFSALYRYTEDYQKPADATVDWQGKWRIFPAQYQSGFPVTVTFYIGGNKDTTTGKVVTTIANAYALPGLSVDNSR